ncbi:MAG: radical SAM protein [Nanoarchaeota archaeon]|nr:radical SAM protein [Nanoarchaeota archaeon]
MGLEELSQGKHSVLFGSGSDSVLYEKLSNTIHVGSRDELAELQVKIEAVSYNPTFETETLRKNKDARLGILLLETTEQCNLRCSYCIYSEEYPNERNETSRSMSLDTAKRAIDEMVPQSNGTMLVGFYGGETMLKMGLVQGVIDHARSTFPSVSLIFSMTSNFVDADRYIPEIVDNEIYVNLSLDGPKAIHDRARKTKAGKPTYDKILSNLKKLEKYSPGYANSHVFVLSTCEDPNDLPKIVDYFDQSDFFVTNINAIETRGKTNPPRTLRGDHGMQSLIDKFRRKILHGEDPGILRRLFDPNLKAMALRDDEIMPRELMLNGSCYPGKKRVFVDVDGNYHPCERFGHRLKIGSVKEGISQELQEEAIKSFTQIRNELCGGCWAQRLCTPCLQNAKDSKGEISEEGLAQTCEGKRNGLLLGLDNYVNLMGASKKKSQEYIETINPLFERG